MTIGDPFSDEAENVSARLNLGSVTVDGTTVSASGFEFVTDDRVTTVAGAFEIAC